MDHLIPIINQLQDVFSTIGSQPIDLPQIAVIGSQSVGKSSVLENIVGRDFLPRGNNIVTRRPLILQLFNTSKKHEIKLSYVDQDDKEEDDDKMDLESNSNSNNSNNEETWGEFLHTGSKKYYDFNAIRVEIEKETDRIAPNKAISSKPISLKIYSPSILNLTLIDLPGITKVPVGNQPKNIEQIVRQLILSFISKPKCLILAVSSATQDLATSDAIQLAKTVDPKGLRTVGVITKIDLMDSGVNALDMLSGNTIPLKLGYIGVVNRSQKDINNNKSIIDAHLSEKMFFKHNEHYRSIASRCGTQYLSYKLNKILINHIKKCLPEVRQSINNNITELENEILSYGIENKLNDNKGALLLDLISKFSENFNNLIDGSGVTNIMIQKLNKYKNKSVSDHELKDNFDEEELFGGARILYIFNTEFKRKLYSLKPFDGLSDTFILSSIRNASGVRSSLFIPEMCFENLVKIQIEKLRKPCLECVDLVYNELKRITAQSETVEITRFYKFNQALNKCVHNLLKKHLDPMIIFINQSIDIQLAYINTNHPDFISMDDVFKEDNERKQQQQSQAQSQNQRRLQKNVNKNVWVCNQCTLENNINNDKCEVCDHLKPAKGQNINYGNDINVINVIGNMRNPPSQREKMELVIIKKFIKSYFDICKKNICDIVPKSIMSILVNKSKKSMQQELALTLYRKDKFELLLAESPQITKKRNVAKDLLQILQKALKILDNVNDYRVSDDHL